jgi:hypothetical protein
MFVVKKNCLFFRLSSQKKCGNTLELLNEHKKEMLARGSWDFIFLEMGKIFGIRKKNGLYFLYLVLTKCGADNC